MDRILVRTATVLTTTWWDRADGPDADEHGHGRAVGVRAGGRERGATATEYAILLGFIFLAVVMAAGWFGQRVGGVMNSDHLGFPLHS